MKQRAGSTRRHGLVLCRILSPGKRVTASAIIARLRGMPLDEACALAGRTIIPVLKDVTLKEAEEALAQFTAARIAGRVTTRREG